LANTGFQTVYNNTGIGLEPEHNLSRAGLSASAGLSCILLSLSTLPTLTTITYLF